MEEKNLKPTFQPYKCGQSTKIRVSFIDDSKAFFVQQESTITELEHLEVCLQNYARVMLEDKNMHEEYLSFQSFSSKFDLVITKSSWDNKWRRAIYLDKTSSESFDQYSDSDEDFGFDLKPALKNRSSKNYFSFFLSIGVEKI